MKSKIKKGDQVIVIAGKEKGKRGEVLQVFPSTSRVVINDVNVVKRHVKAQSGYPGQIVEKEAPIHISNVALWNEAEGRIAKIGYMATDEGKVRIDKRSGNPI